MASVSCIYGLGSPDDYRKNLLLLKVGEEYDQRAVLRQLVDMRYDRNDAALSRGKFRVRGDIVEVHPAYDESTVRIQFFGDEIEAITVVDSLTGEKVGEHEDLAVYPATHYVAGEDRMAKAVVRIEAELQERLAQFEKEGKLLEAQRLRMRTQYDLEMMQEVGYCNGIENYSAPIDGRAPGETPNTLIDFFPDDFLVVIDESHVAVPQLHGQYEGDRSRKQILIDHGFRLPSAADNRPLQFDEFTDKVNQVVFVSATPVAVRAAGESTGSSSRSCARPGWSIPRSSSSPPRARSTTSWSRSAERIEADERVLITTLTKKMSEDLSEYLLEQGVRCRYLHSNIDTIERIEILRALRLGEFDVLVGINLLREGLDLPEVSLVAILDADKEGFLRSETSLIQTMGRAARNVNGQVIMYADKVTDSMQRAISEVQRRRQLQLEYNEEHGIDPQTIRKAVTDILSFLRGSDGKAPMPDKDKRKRSMAERQKIKELTELPQDDIERLVVALEEEMHEAAEELRFEYAARLRDEIKDLRRGMVEAT